MCLLKVMNLTVPTFNNYTYNHSTHALHTPTLRLGPHTKTFMWRTTNTHLNSYYGRYVYQCCYLHTTWVCKFYSTLLMLLMLYSASTEIDVRWILFKWLFYLFIYLKLFNQGNSTSKRNETTNNCQTHFLLDTIAGSSGLADQKKRCHHEIHIIFELKSTVCIWWCLVTMLLAMLQGILFDLFNFYRSAPQKTWLDDFQLTTVFGLFKGA